MEATVKNESTEEEEEKEEEEEEEEEALPFLIRLLPEERKGAKILLIHSQRDFFPSTLLDFSYQLKVGVSPNTV